MTPASGLALYGQTAGACSAPVIGRYSTSFGLATRLFPRRVRSSIAAVYALVRVADEIVDGTAAEAGLDRDAQRAVLDGLERETQAAVATGFSANVIVHAFAVVARRCGFEPELTRDFFASMRRDLDGVDFDDPDYRSYVHGSAEVVGLMCLRIFLAGRAVPAAERATLEQGAARLGAAFQKINFLRDLDHDRTVLERSYLPELRAHGLTAAAKAAVVADIRSDLRVARTALPHLPRDCRRPVQLAAALFADLLARLDRAAPEDLLRARVSVPAPVKLALFARHGVLGLPVGGQA